MSLFEKEEPNPSKFTINKEFAKKFEHRKKREHLEKAQRLNIFKEKLKEEKINNQQSDSSSSSESEDENGELINEDLVHDFVKSLAKIRDKKPEIYNPQTTFFTEDYKENENLQKKMPNKKDSLFYKDMVREDLLNKGKIQEQTKITEETPVEEQMRLKREFQMASKLANDEENFFSIKQKTQKDIENENILFDKFLKEEAKKNKPDEVEMLKRFWGDDQKLDETDKFLRRYIMTKGWIDEDLEHDDANEVDKEDDERDEEIEEFEEKYNFRFEEPDSNKIITYGREIPDSLRKKNETRKEKRKEKNERKKTEKKKLEEEIKQLKKIKKEEILERLEKIQKIGGSKDIPPNFEDFLEEDFDPNKYDKQMNENFNETYYGNEDENEEDIKMYIKEIKKNEKSFLEQTQKNNEENTKEKGNDFEKAKNENEDKENVLIPKTTIPIPLKNNLNKMEIKEMKDSGKTIIWWYCDECNKGIQEFESHFDCLECEDYTLCKKCYDLKDHNHKMRKGIVPEGCTPPPDEEIKQILMQYKNCQFCKIKLGENSEYYYEKTKEDNILCEVCFLKLDFKTKKNYLYKESSSEGNLQEIAKKNPHKLKDFVQDEEIQKLVDEYYGLDFEDIIAGNIKTKFKYTNVEREDYGLDDELLLYTNDKLLNNYVSLKRLAPYSDKNLQLKQRSLKKKKRLLEKNAEDNKNLILKQKKKIEKYEKKIKGMKPKTKHQKKKKRILTKKLENIKNSSIQTLQKKSEKQPKMEIENLNPEKPSQNTNITNDRLKSYGLMNAPNK